MERISLIDRMCKHLREQGSLQIIDLAKLLNNDVGYKKVTRNTVNTLLYTVKDRFEKVGYGRFNVLDGNEEATERGIVRKIINYNHKLLSKINFSEKELKIINKIRKRE
ncbi:hypothetical protein LCGC14_1203230 [marine sediment metagenome]|uniref:Uncharacterized protein n=1 Tax=marine sediment metagenome TaxID=412755 RepID=A0A0F9LKP3_9ZZZZ